MTTNPREFFDEPNPYKEARSRQEGAKVLFGLLALLATSSVHVRIDDTEHDKEGS